jgi:hypothetical protein
VALAGAITGQALMGGASHTDASEVSVGFPRIFLARHGETAWSLTGRHTGMTDLPLTECGERNARRLGERLKGHRFAAVFASPLQRAWRTCELAGFAREARAGHPATPDMLIDVGRALLAKLARAPGNATPIGGLKVIAEHGRFAGRPSGTGSLCQIYAENSRDAAHRRSVVREAEQLASRALSRGTRMPSAAQAPRMRMRTG